MIPIVPTNLPPEDTYNLTLKSLLKVQEQSKQIFSQVQDKILTLQQRFDRVSDRLSNVEQAFQNSQDLIQQQLLTDKSGQTNQAELHYECPQHLHVNDDRWCQEPVLQDFGAKSLQVKLNNEVESLNSNSVQNNEQEHEIKVENDLDSADLYNFFLGVQEESVQTLNQQEKQRPQSFSSFNDLFLSTQTSVNSDNTNRNQLAHLGGQYVRVIPRPIPSEAGETGSRVHSEKFSHSLDLSSFTQSSLLSNKSVSRSTFLKARRDARRRKYGAGTSSSVSTLLRHAKHPGSPFRTSQPGERESGGQGQGRASSLSQHATVGFSTDAVYGSNLKVVIPVVSLSISVASRRQRVQPPAR
eukprot:TRINITY_DN1752_c0_g1_i12.p1 TRINITY_DN1752_c0_g1~~TRINITY_DN1752_c0_g1_i12.p1  ORF type:complete len:384 (+),score=23.95 TRINITY_DN1752_c0_g1_i12:89-1153(+)